jgi:general secretion pathway protein B
MSSILKALKKLEEEQSSGRNGNADVARGILMGAPRRTGKPGWVLPVSVAGAAFAAAMLTYLMTGGAAPRNKEFSPTVPMKIMPKAGDGTGQTEAFSPASSPRELSRKDEPSTPAVPKPPMDRDERIIGTTLPSGNGPSFHLSKTPDATGRSSVEQDRVQAVSKPTAHAAETVQTSQVRSLPTLKVSGIAWQKDGADRLAVVNGMPVTEGMNIGGARVEEIFQDKVRFSFEKRAFDVVVGKESQ